MMSKPKIDVIGKTVKAKKGKKLTIFEKVVFNGNDRHHRIEREILSKKVYYNKSHTQTHEEIHSFPFTPRFEWCLDVYKFSSFEVPAYKNTEKCFALFSRQVSDSHSHEFHTALSIHLVCRDILRHFTACPNLP